eukprot:7292155-Karenia_brevis.AAC.1
MSKQLEDFSSKTSGLASPVFNDATDFDPHEVAFVPESHSANGLAMAVEVDGHTSMDMPTVFYTFPSHPE